MSRGFRRLHRCRKRSAAFALASLLLAWPAAADTVDAQRIEERLPEPSPAARPDPSTTAAAPLKVDEADLAAIPEFVLARAELVAALESVRNGGSYFSAPVSRMIVEGYLETKLIALPSGAAT